MRRVLSRALMILVLMGLVAGAAACSKEKHWRWRKTSGEEYRIAVVVPQSNPHNNNNQEAWFVQAVQDAGHQWDMHPDITVEVYVATGPENDWCKFHHGSPDTENSCVEAWLVPKAYMVATYGAGIAGVSVQYAGPQFATNGPLADPSRFLLYDDWSAFGDDAVAARHNAACHEMGHNLGLAHADPVDLDQDPETGPDGKEYDPPGPCQDSAPDRHLDPPYDILGYDWQNIAHLYPTCTNDATGPAGTARDPHGVNDLSSGGYESCGAGAAQADVADDPGPVVAHVQTDTFRDAA